MPIAHQTASRLLLLPLSLDMVPKADEARLMVKKEGGNHRNSEATERYSVGFICSWCRQMNGERGSWIGEVGSEENMRMVQGQHGGEMRWECLVAEGPEEKV